MGRPGPVRVLGPRRLIVLADDYPLFRPHMYEREVAGGIWRERVRHWLEANAAFRQGLLDEMARRGPLFAEQIESRAAPKMDRQAGRLLVNAVHWEPGVEPDSTTRAAAMAAIESLGQFLGAASVDYPLS